MVNLMTKTLGIHLIFAKDSSGNYTKDALLYQDILGYSIRGLETLDSNSEYPFKLWQLTEWLISNNHEISDDYKKSADSHKTTSNKIESRIGRVKRHVDILQYLGLIGEYSITKESKGDGLTTLYSITEFGLIVALLILTRYASKKEKAIKFLYETLCKNFENSGSLGAYCLSFTKKMYEENLFDNYVRTMLETAEENNSIMDINGFFANSLLLELNDNDSKKFLQIKNEAFDSLSPEMRNRFMDFTKLVRVAAVISPFCTLSFSYCKNFRIPVRAHSLAPFAFSENKLHRSSITVPTMNPMKSKKVLILRS